MASTLTARHDKIKAFDWEPNYFRRDAKYPTKYKIPSKTKDPFRTLIRDYVNMEEDKDERTYGSLELAKRMNNVDHVEPRFLEVMKPVLSIVPYGEYSGVKLTAMLIDTLDNAEMRQGYLAQMVDEVRHVNLQAYLQRHFAKTAPDPAGFNCGFRTRTLNPLGRPGRAMFEMFTNGDPITNSLYLMMGETAYTNPLFVAATEVAAANGDHTTSSVFLSIQSDEARHIANGYSTLAAVLADSDNLPMLQEDFDKAFWRSHLFFDNFLAMLYDSFTKVRIKPYKDYWNQWVWEDFLGSYIERLAPFGLQVPQWIDLAKANIEWGGHTTAIVAASLWPVHAWRSDCMDEDDFAWLEGNYPGWEEHFGGFWREYREMSDPRNGRLPLDLFEAMPAICRVCQLPAVFPRPDLAQPRYRIDADGRRHAFCSEPCEYIFRAEPHAYANQTWWEINDGTSLADYIVAAGLLRSDGRTLIGQPHLKTDERWLWTIDDIRRHGFEIRDPLPQVPAEEFLPI